MVLGFWMANTVIGNTVSQIQRQTHWKLICVTRQSEIAANTVIGRRTEQIKKGGPRQSSEGGPSRYAALPLRVTRQSDTAANTATTTATTRRSTREYREDPKADRRERRPILRRRKADRTYLNTSQ